jgi:two-component system alkaline phosphatase synthesis response regulator PhoP
MTAARSQNKEEEKIMGDKIKIVMIDDEPDLCLVVKDNLEDKGEFEVTTLTDPLQAETVIRQHLPDLILLDIVMPKRKGQEIIAALKKDQELKSIPIIVVSGKGEMVYNKKKDEFKWTPHTKLVQERGPLPEVKGAEELAKAYGVDDYVSKPFTTDVLVSIIKEVLQKKRKKTEPEETPGIGI